MLQVVRLRIASMMADVPGVGMTRVRRRLALTSRVRYSASVRRARLKRRLQYRGMTGQRQGPPGVTGGAVVCLLWTEPPFLTICAAG